jgi:hypothetical protein
MMAQAGWMPQLINMLSWWQWAILLAVPPAIILLYFLKLKRRPLEVPSTYLWHRSIEDLHVNTVWQRLRRNLLLFLQLLLIFLAMLAVLRPGWRGSKVSGNRFIFLIDNSASMQATDSGPSRLDEAKRQARALIDQMSSRDAAMIVYFSDAAGTRIKQMFTSNRRQLRRGLDAIKPSDHRTALDEALKLASGLANPGRSAEDASDVQVADPKPAALYIFSDGRFPEVSDFRLGNLEPVYMPIGSEEAENVGVLAFNVRRNESDPTRMEVFARIGNFGLRDAELSVELWNPLLHPDGPIAVGDYEVLAQDSRRVAFSDVSVAESGVLELRVISADDLKCDDVAWAVINPPQRSKVLVVTPGNEFLDVAFSTGAVLELADVSFAGPAFLDGKEYAQQAVVGGYDLVIYDRCRPEKLLADKTIMPKANTLFIGEIPPTPGDDEPAEAAKEKTEEEALATTRWRTGPEVEGAIIIGSDSTHPLMQLIDLGDVLVDLPTPLVEMPPGGSSLIDVQWIGPDGASKVAPAMGIAPRGGFEDAVMGFKLVDVAEDGTAGTFFGTDWPIRASFPVFVLNLLYYLGGCQTALEGASVQPGQPITLQTPLPGQKLEVLTPGGQTIKLRETRAGKFDFTDASELGVYEVRAGGNTMQRFAVNLFHAGESDIRPASKVQIGRGMPVDAPASRDEITRRELWKWILLLGLGVLLVEWYIYNRRVYL